jgi:hypothetical protein
MVCPPPNPAFCLFHDGEEIVHEIQVRDRCRRWPFYSCPVRVRPDADQGRRGAQGARKTHDQRGSPQKALEQAEADVKTAKAKFALWTTAETGLKQAQEAAKAGDSASVIKQAAFVSDQVKSGLAQLSYPSTEQK